MADLLFDPAGDQQRFADFASARKQDALGWQQPGLNQAWRVTERLLLEKLA